MLGLSACSSDDDSSLTEPEGVSREDALTYFAADEEFGDTTVYRSDDRFANEEPLRVGQDRSIALDYDGTLYQVGSTVNGRGVRAMTRARVRGSAASFDSAADREIGGSLSGLQDPVSMTLARREGLLFISDRGTDAVSVFGAGAAGDVAPLGRTQLSGPPSATAYDEDNDRLFIARDGGAVDIYDRYVEEQFYASMVSPPPSRTFRLMRGAGSTDSAAISALRYDASVDCLYAADTGAMGDDIDGAIHRIDTASLRTGDVDPSFTLSGPNAALKDPMDLEVFGGRLRVADQGSGRMRQYELHADDFGTIDRRAFASRVAAGATAVVTEPLEPSYQPMPSDIDDPASDIRGLGIASVPREGAASNNQVSRLSFGTGTFSSFNGTMDPSNSICSMAYDAVGDGFFGYENAQLGTGGVLVASRVGSHRRRAGVDDEYSASRDRRIEGPATGLTTPRGIDIDDASGMLMVADSQSRTIRVFDKGAAGDVAPRFTTSTSGAPYGVDYDSTNDRLYVSGDDGCVCVYDRFMETRPAAPDRRFGFNNGVAGSSQESLDLRGVAYDETNDRLLVSDVGTDAGVGDGRIYGYEGASFANSTVTPTQRFTSTAQTMVMEPTGIAFNGSTAYVGDASSGQVYQYDNVFGGPSADPTASYPATNAGDVAFQTGSMAPRSGGSYR